MLSSGIFAIHGEESVKDDVSVVYETLADGSIRVMYAVNESSNSILILLDGNEAVRLNRGDSEPQSAKINKIARNTVKYGISNDVLGVLWKRSAVTTQPVVDEALAGVEPTPLREENNYSSGKVGNRKTPSGKSEDGYNRRTVEKRDESKSLENEAGTMHVDRGDSSGTVQQGEVLQGNEGTSFLSRETLMNYLIIGTVVIIIVILIFLAIKKRRVPVASDKAGMIPVKDKEINDQSIVVRRRTTSILKRQSIDDVVGNPDYLKINAAEFVNDSAVRNIYIKNTCIKEVYNLYAQDLRNSDNPKEDGCMVLGRWVHDEENGTYDVSLETVVFPGDDAVFKEYELNFGGKIKLRIAEKLRKLRRETNLQYDLVCWIHSHPGLGVFFSNSDDSVQMQLRHSQHPNFLVAFVVDILTDDQELGIFTFRKDGSMNSKGDLTRLYSLEEMFKWALESGRRLFDPANCYNLLNTAEKHIFSCEGIELDNSSIIDLAGIVADAQSEIAGWAVGTSVMCDGKREYVVSSIVRNSERPAVGVIGILVNVSHMSLPTIQRLVSAEIVKPDFIMAYSSRQDSLTIIPTVDGKLLDDEKYYGEVSIDDLKIWTRRKR
jgi:hypothetical protein